ncbi:MAG: hypothetical protein HFH68_14490 [Lachnospiraceae bacterium]|nr:hypothetical protein [Lachnospiraceae bacterium]
MNKIFVQSEELITSVVEAAGELQNEEDKSKLIGSISMMIEIGLWETITGYYPGC